MRGRAPCSTARGQRSDRHHQRHGHRHDRRSGQAEHDRRDRGRPHRRGRRGRRHEDSERRASGRWKGEVPHPRPLGHAHPHVLRRLGARRQGSHAAPLHCQRHHRRARHGQRPRADPRRAARRRERRAARPAHDHLGPHARRPEVPVPRRHRDHDARGRPPRRGHAQGPRCRLHQDPVLRPARGLLRDRGRVPQAEHRLRGPRAGCHPCFRSGRRGTEELRAPDRRLRGQLHDRGRPHEGAEGAGPVSRHLRRRARGGADPAPREEERVAVPHALLGARPVARRRDRRDQGSRREVRARFLAREELAEVHGRNHQGPRHGPPARPREVRRARARDRQAPAEGRRAVPRRNGHARGRRRAAGLQPSPGDAALRGRGLHAHGGAPDGDDQPGEVPRQGRRLRHGREGQDRRPRPARRGSARATSATRARSPPSSRTAATTRARSWTRSWRTSRPTPPRTDPSSSQCFGPLVG